MKKLILAGAVVALTGCSAFQNSTQSVKVTCIPENVTIMVNGTSRECPSVLELPRDKASLIEASKRGYTSSVRQIGYHFGTMGKLDLLGTVLFGVPVIGLMTNGAWDLDETELSITLSPI